MEISRRFLIFLRITSILLNFFMNLQKSWIIYSILIATLFIQIIEVLWLLKTNGQSNQDQNQYLTIILITPLIIELQIQWGFKGVDIIGTLFLECLFFLNYRKNTNGNHFRAFYLIPSFLAIRLIIILKESQNFTILVQIYLIVLPFISEITNNFRWNSHNISNLITDEVQRENVVQKIKEVDEKLINDINLDSDDQHTKKIIKTFTIKQQQLCSDSLCSSDSSIFFKRILNLLPYGCIVLNANCEVVYSNLKFLKMFKASNEEEILKQISKIIQGSKMDYKRQQSTDQYFSPNNNNLNQIPFQYDFNNIVHQNQSENQEGFKDIESLVQRSREYSMSQLRNESQFNFKMSSFVNLNYEIEDENDEKRNYKIKVYNSIQGSNKNFISNSDITLIIIKNVTEQKELKIIKQQHKFQNQLLESFSHELRTPLNCSIQSIQAVIQMGITRQLESLLNSALGSNYLLLHQINDILDTAAIETQNFQYNWCDFTIQEIINEITSIYSESLKIKSITLQPKSNRQDLYTKIKSDKARILQILINLMNNSVKFTREGGSISFYTEVMVKSDSSRYIKFELIDNGVGIEQNKLKQIKTTLSIECSPKIKNIDTPVDFMGLGLTVCSKLAEGLTQQVKNNLVVKSQPLEGTSVSFFVDDHKSTIYSANNLSYQSQIIKSLVEKSLEFQNPQFLNDHQITAQQNGNSKFEYQIKIPELDLCFDKVNHQKNKINSYIERYLGVIQRKKINEPQCKLCTQILIVDDVPFNHIALKAILSTFYLQSDSAYDGIQALEMIQQRVKDHCKTYRLILMDIEMPDWNGFQTTSKIRQYLSKDLSLISHIVMCSAYDSKDNVEKAVACGMSGFLIKPVKAENLKKILQKYSLFGMR